MAEYRTWSENPLAGFSILELLVVTVIIGTLSTMFAPSLQRAREQAQVGAAAIEIRVIEAELAIYFEINFALPVSLAAIDRAGMVDPWGYPYIYVVVTGPGGRARTSSWCRSTPTTTCTASEQTARVLLPFLRRSLRTTSSVP